MDLRARLTVALALAFAAPTLLGAADPYVESVKPFLHSRCASCHSGAMPAGSFAVDSLTKLPQAETLQNRTLWEMIARRIRAGEMPPKGAPAAPAGEVQAVAAWIEAEYDRMDRTGPVDPGKVTARRLNRVEFSNSVRDLLGGLDMGLAQSLPADPYGYGFDNIGDVLSMNAGLADQYLKAAELISQAAIPIDGDAPPATMERYLAERIGQDRQLRMRVDHTFPVDGEYTLRSAFFQALKDGTRVRMRLMVDGREVASGVLSFYYQIDRAIDAPRVRVTAGRHRVEASIEVLPEQNYKGAPPYLEYVQVYGPHAATRAAETSTYRRFFTCGHAPGEHGGGAAASSSAESCAKLILAPLARAAMRRPVAASEVEGLLALVAREEKRTKSFEKAMRSGLQALLVSPHFLFRVERDPRGAEARPLNPHELAARLSYFLWSSLPDAELARAADEGTLPRVLREQTVRMLADPKSAALIENFTGQWLQTRNLAVSRPDPTRFPSFTGELADAMRTETEMLFGAILAENRPILDFLDARFTFLNARLAAHYGIKGIEGGGEDGETFRRVELDGVERSGVLTHASVLTVSSYPTRTSPVIRGKWILENILNEPPPPPPPNVPPLDEKTAGASAGSMRQQLEKHRTNAACAACHSRMDPLGFGLENYDAIGRWRRTEDGSAGGAPIDASGALPGGVTFSTPAELKQIVKANRDAFARALVEKMLTYATGRGMEVRDRAAVRRVSERLRERDYRMRELILAVVESEPFRMRSGGRE